MDHSEALDRADSQFEQLANTPPSPSQAQVTTDLQETLQPGLSKDALRTDYNDTRDAIVNDLLTAQPGLSNTQQQELTLKVQRDFWSLYKQTKSEINTAIKNSDSAKIESLSKQFKDYQVDTLCELVAEKLTSQYYASETSPGFYTHSYILNNPKAESDLVDIVSIDNTAFNDAVTYLSSQITALPNGATLNRSALEDRLANSIQRLIRTTNEKLEVGGNDYAYKDLEHKLTVSNTNSVAMLAAKELEKEIQTAFAEKQVESLVNTYKDQNKLTNRLINHNTPSLTGVTRAFNDSLKNPLGISQAMLATTNLSKTSEFLSVNFDDIKGVAQDIVNLKGLEQAEVPKVTAEITKYVLAHQKYARNLLMYGQKEFTAHGSSHTLASWGKNLESFGHNSLLSVAASRVVDNLTKGKTPNRNDYGAILKTEQFLKSAIAIAVIEDASLLEALSVNSSMSQLAKVWNTGLINANDRLQQLKQLDSTLEGADLDRIATSYTSGGVALTDFEKMLGKLTVGRLQQNAPNNIAILPSSVTKDELIKTVQELQNSVEAEQDKIHDLERHPEYYLNEFQQRIDKFKQEYDKETDPIKAEKLLEQLEKLREKRDEVAEELNAERDEYLPHSSSQAELNAYAKHILFGTASPKMARAWENKTVASKIESLKSITEEVRNNLDYLTPGVKARAEKHLQILEKQLQVLESEHALKTFFHKGGTAGVSDVLWNAGILPSWIKHPSTQKIAEHLLTGKDLGRTKGFWDKLTIEQKLDKISDIENMLQARLDDKTLSKAEQLAAKNHMETLRDHKAVYQQFKSVVEIIPERTFGRFGRAIQSTFNFLRQMPVTGHIMSFLDRIPLINRLVPKGCTDADLARHLLVYSSNDRGMRDKIDKIFDKNANRQFHNDRAGEIWKNMPKHQKVAVLDRIEKRYLSSEKGSLWANNSKLIENIEKNDAFAKEGNRALILDKLRTNLDAYRLHVKHDDVKQMWNDGRITAQEKQALGMQLFKQKYLKAHPDAQYKVLDDKELSDYMKQAWGKHIGKGKNKKLFADASYKDIKDFIGKDTQLNATFDKWVKTFRTSARFYHVFDKAESTTIRPTVGERFANLFKQQ